MLLGSPKQNHAESLWNHPKICFSTRNVTNLSKSHKHSLSIPLGKVKITRKVADLTIIVRSYTSTSIDKSKIMLDQNKSRIFEKPKLSIL